MPLAEITTSHSRALKDDIAIRMPSERDGSEIWRLVKVSGMLDENSMYCNLLQCTHFASTCALAERGGEIIGWVSGYIPPEHPERLFVWQVCVSKSERGRGLSGRLIRDVLERDACSDITRLDTTITDDNDASWSLFRKVARSLEADLYRSEYFEKETHFDGRHQTEHLVSIGPFNIGQATVRTAA